MSIDLVYDIIKRERERERERKKKKNKKKKTVQYDSSRHWTKNGQFIEQ